jgi:ABC-2 type transport system ATP-binding protein
MALIEVRDLCKSFVIKESGRGVRGRLKGLFAPHKSTFDAVKGLSFTVEKGEIVGFMGPNGAGKSTTIKILTGILHPTSGHVQVCGLTPWEYRKQLAYSLGTVFGQRPQLWYHLPALDTLLLFGKIYGKSNKETQDRITHLAQVLDCNDLLHVPVRKLSLGQRMRCELIASLIHNPQLLLLDEPSIGLDVVSKAKLRAHIKRLNEDEGVTVLLTSHDTADLEALCSRVVVINHGQVIYQNRLEEMKRDLMALG